MAAVGVAVGGVSDHRLLFLFFPDTCAVEEDASDGDDDNDDDEVDNEFTVAMKDHQITRVETTLEHTLTYCITAGSRAGGNVPFGGEASGTTSFRNHTVELCWWETYTPMIIDL